jgi:hypothetical protein
MLIGAIRDFKDTIFIEKEHSKSDRQYMRKLQESLKIDLLKTAEEFNIERKSIEAHLNKVDSMTIKDKYLITKCEELLESSSKLAKKLTKYQNEKHIKCTRFKEMYTIYLLISEANRNISIMRSYATQFNKYNSNN